MSQQLQLSINIGQIQSAVKFNFNKDIYVSHAYKRSTRYERIISVSHAKQNICSQDNEQSRIAKARH